MTATILVVEDDQTAAETIRDVLVAAGYLVPETASSGTEALEAATRVRPVLTLMDVQLVGAMDGIDTAHELRKRSTTRIIYITAFTDDNTLRRAKQTAPLGYLKKPFSPRELRVAVEIALHQASLEDAIVAREKWFSTTLHSIGDAVLTTDGADRVTFLNPAAEQMLGVALVDAVGEKIDAVVRFVNARGEVQPALTRLTPAGPGRRDALPRDARLLARREGVAEPVLLEIEGNVAPIALDAGNTFGSVMVFRDVGERRKLERRLGTSERMAAIGTMAAGMQHEINNPLASVVANVQFSLDALKAATSSGLSAKEVGELVTALGDASEGAERIRRTVEELRHFSRSAEAIEAPTEIHAALDEAVRVTAHAVRHHATVRKEYGSPPRVLAEEGQLLRVFMNLLINAARAAGDGGATEHSIVLRTRADGTGRAVIEVIDQGPGLSEERLRRIFDPFFTPLPDSTEIGLGLAISHGIVVSLGGEIEAESELGKGTTFRVLLPAARPKTATRPRQMATLPPPSIGAAKSRARVLVVDDEVAIGKALRRILSGEHDVTLESDARVALERLDNETYDVVFCDLMMPNMSGMDFYDELSRRSPHQAQRIVFLTGGAFSPRSEEFLRGSRNVCLSKPFSRDAVSAVVRTMIAAPSAEAS
ncbi:MAG: Sensory box histidine kinase/response regulator [Labilithrix sp.]|nr:Sensory box histidine kinase/response regulator [Labilithrix sp.]